MTADDVKALRKSLKCTARQLAQVLETDPADVVAWETGERFPTKQAIQKMQKLAAGGMSALTRPSARSAPVEATASSVNSALFENPKLWKIVRRLVEDPAFFEQVTKLAETRGNDVH